MSEFLIIIGLILLNGFLAMSEIALISVRKSHLLSEANKGNRSAKTALLLSQKPDNFLSTVQIGITIVGILTGIYSGSALADDFSTVLVGWGVSPDYSRTLGQIVIVVFVTYLTLVFGELVPKRIGMSTSSQAAKIVARPMYVLSMIASPFVWLLAKSTSFIFNLFGLKTDQEKVTEEEIKSMIQEGTREGEVQEVEQDIMERVFLLGDLKISSLMTHRSDVTVMDVTMDSKQIRAVLQEHLHDFYPVVDRNYDNIKGVVTLKKLVFELNKPNLDLNKIMSSAIFFHETMSVYKALERMKDKRIGQALICDEFGDFQGVITLKDILEGLVGNIEDTYAEPDIIKRKEGDGWLIDGQCPVYDFLAYFNKEDWYSNQNDYSTVGGLVLEELQHIPQSGEAVKWKGFLLEIMDMDGARIDKILVKVLE
jgi:putative hemolysin